MTLGHERMIATTDLRHGCTKQHTGTSAAAPLAAAMVALMLEANRNLTWRDVQHITVQTSNPRGLIASDWQSNGVGRCVALIRRHVDGLSITETSLTHSATA